MRFSQTALISSLGVAFAAGVATSMLAEHVIPDVHAESAPMAPVMFDLTALKHDDLARTAYPELNGRGIVTTNSGTVGIQSGNLPKHLHPKTFEVQYIIEGSGAMWLGDKRQEFKPGTLIVIPNGTPHAGSLVTNGPVKALVIKMPPQAPGDVVLLD